MVNNYVKINFTILKIAFEINFLFNNLFVVILEVLKTKIGNYF